MNRRKISQLNNNEGFSLLELLISVIILAIIVIPFLRMFLTSSNLNIKSRKTLRATTVAQDIMEGFKAYDIEELKEQFNNPAGGFYVINDSIIKGGVGEDTVREAAEVGIDADGNPNSGYYCFTLEGVTLQGSEYDALVTVDGRDYADGGSHTLNQKNVGTDGITAKAHNNAGFAAVTAIDESVDGIYVEKADMTQEILDRLCQDSDFRDLFETNGIDPADVTFKTDGLSVSRFYTVDIGTSGVDSEGNIIADAEVTVEYECSYASLTKSFFSLNHIPCASFSSGNFYFLYYPFYDAFYEGLTINNGADIPLCLTIAKQIYSSEDPEDSNVLSDAQLNAAELGYDIEVNIIGGSLEQTRIRTNLGTNLTNSSFLGGEGETTDVPGQVKFTFEGDSPKMNVYTLSGVRNTVLGAEGTDDEVTEVIYDITVEVYKAGAADNGFPQEDRMVSLDGSKNN